MTKIYLSNGSQFSSINPSPAALLASFKDLTGDIEICGDLIMTL